MSDLVILSMHDHGYPQADMYQGCGEMPAIEFEALGMAPDDFFTLRRIDTIADAWTKARERWPGAKIVEAADEADEDED